MVISLSPGTEELLSASFQTNLTIWVGEGYISNSGYWERRDTYIPGQRAAASEVWAEEEICTLCELLLLYPVLKDVWICLLIYNISVPRYMQS